MLRRIFAVLTGCLLLTMGSSPCAQTPTKMYWTESCPYKTLWIQRANLDGSECEQLLSEVDGVKGIAIDFQNDKMYFANNFDSKIERANLDGTDREDVLTGVSPEGIALDLAHGKMYWTNYTYNHATIMRANLDGTDAEEITSHLGNGCVLEDIAVDVPGGKVYWIERFDREIRRANLDGSYNEQLLRCSDGVVNPFGIAVGNGKMYWSSADFDEIYRADLDGENNTVLVTGLNDPRYLALDTTNGKIYWGSDGNWSIRRVNLDGTGLEDLVTGIPYPWGIALDYNEACLPVGPTSLTPHAEEMTEAQALPTEFGLSQNAPNPFNPQTTIAYQLPEASDVRLTVCNVAGQVVQVLVDARKEAGAYTAVWDAHGFGSGIYLVRMEAGDFVEVRKMAVVR